MGVLQSILNLVDFEMTPQEAVLAPRFFASDTILVTARILRYSYRELEAQGYRFLRSPYSYQIASVQAIGFDDNGEPSGGADIPYGDTMVLRINLGGSRIYMQALLVDSQSRSLEAGLPSG